MREGEGNGVSIVKIEIGTEEQAAKEQRYNNRALEEEWRCSSTIQGQGYLH